MDKRPGRVASRVRRSGLTCTGRRDGRPRRVDGPNVGTRGYGGRVDESQERVGEVGGAGAVGEVEVRRSARRRRTIQAYRDGDRTVVLVPAHLTAQQEREEVAKSVARLDARDDRGERATSDAALAERAQRLSRRYLGGRARPTSVRWVTNQNTRWGSCTPSTGAIRVSHRVQGMPEYVVDYVVLHELAHLVEANHSPRFWALLDAYPERVKAEGFLDGASWPRR